MTQHGDPKPLRIMCNAGWFQGRAIGDRPVEAGRFVPTGFWCTLRAFFSLRPFDVVVVNVEGRQLAAFCLIKLLWPWARWRIVSVDLVVPPARNRLQRLRLALVRFLMKQVDLFLLYFKDTRALEAAYGIDRRKIRYVPFKINSYDFVATYPVRDDGFILSCGQSNRDYATFCRAMEGLPYPAHIVAPAPSTGHKHGTTFDFQSLPPNVHWLTHDGAEESWVDWISRARCVVLPVLPDTLVATGISTYLVAMALGKCVIMTDSPGTRGLLDCGRAVIVPPADPEALRAAMTEVFENAEYREKVASQGQAYALALKDENRLAADVAAEVGRFLGLPEDHEEDQSRPLQLTGGTA